MKKLLSILCIVAIVASFFVGVMAADNVKEITATINYNLKMKFDNVEWNPTEADGSAIRPITYNGRTYLPVRALAEKIGIAIDWDQATQTVLIGEKDWTPLTVDLVSSTSSNHTGSYTTDSDALYNGNGVFERGIVIEPQWFGNQFSDYTLAPNGKYQTMQVSFYVQGSDATIFVADPDTKQNFKNVEVKANTVTTVDINIGTAKEVEFKWQPVNEKAVTSMIFGDIKFK